MAAPRRALRALACAARPAAGALGAAAPPAVEDAARGARDVDADGEGQAGLGPVVAAGPDAAADLRLARAGGCPPRGPRAPVGPGPGGGPRWPRGWAVRGARGPPRSA